MLSILVFPINVHLCKLILNVTGWSRGRGGGAKMDCQWTSALQGLHSGPKTMINSPHHPPPPPPSTTPSEFPIIFHGEWYMCNVHAYTFFNCTVEQHLLASPIVYKKHILPPSSSKCTCKLLYRGPYILLAK